MSAARILVIDDSTTLRKLVEIAMRGTGMNVDFAATGAEGILQAPRNENTPTIGAGVWGTGKIVPTVTTSRTSATSIAYDRPEMLKHTRFSICRRGG